MSGTVFHTGARVTWTRDTKKDGIIRIPAVIARVNRTTARIRIHVEQLDLFDGPATREHVERTVPLDQLAAR